MIQYIWLVPAFPLVGVVINGLFGRSYLRERAHLVAVPAAGLSFLVALLIALEVVAGRTLDLHLYPWIVAGHFQVPVGFLVYPLPALLRLPEPLHVLHADARPGQQLSPHVPGLGGSGALLVPVDRVLV